MISHAIVQQSRCRYKRIFAISCFRSAFITVSARHLLAPQTTFIYQPPPSGLHSPLIGERRMISDMPGIDTDLTSEWKSKIDRLSKNSSAVQQLSLKERVQVIDEILGKVQSIKDDRSHQHDLAVLKLGPVPSDSTEPPYKYRGFSKKFLALNKFGTVSLMTTALKNMKRSLEHQIAVKAGDTNIKVPELLARKSKEDIAGRSMNIYGPVEVFPMFHKVEIWADASETISEERSEDIENPAMNSNDDGITVVLGAGNQSFITFLDVLHCFFSSPQRPVFIKHHPLRPHLIDAVSELFSPLIERGFLEQVVDKDLSETKSILQHPKVSHVHVTGSEATAHAIEATLSESRPNLTIEEIENMISSELGCVTPWIISPGHYTKRELKIAAKHIVISKKMNAGCNCLAAQVVVLPSDWKQKHQFKGVLREEFEKVSTVPLYYAGSRKKVEDIVSRYDSDRVSQIPSKTATKVFDDDDADCLHPYIVDCGTFNEDGYNNNALKNEAFGPMMAIVELPGGDCDGKYLLETAVPFANKEIYGSLSCSLVLPKDADKKMIRDATGALNYGCVAVNTWSFYGYYSFCHGGMWGGSRFDSNAQSGRGKIGNIFQIPHAEKTVVYSRSLEFPILLDPSFMPPAFLSDGASAAFVAKSLFGA